MSRKLDAYVDEQGQVHLLQPVRLAGRRRAVVEIWDEDPAECMRVSEPALAEDWNRPEEEAAWAHLQPGP